MEKPRPLLIQTKWKMPPREKIHEALSAVLDDRVVIEPGNRADVWSSDRSKRYTVTWSEDLTSFGANDNASFYQGYVGYPIIAVLLKLGALPLPINECLILRDVPWKSLNKKHRNNYAKAVDEILTDRVTSTDERQAIETYIDETLGRLVGLELSRERPVGPPPS